MYHHRNRLTRSQRDVQTPTGLQSMEYLYTLDYDEIILLKSINYFFENQHLFYNGKKEELLFELVDDILDKVSEGRIPLNVDDYYTGDIDDESDHGNPTLMKRLLRDAGSYLYKKMYNPNLIKREKRRAQLEECPDFR